MLAPQIKPQRRHPFYPPSGRSAPLHRPQQKAPPVRAGQVWGRLSTRREDRRARPSCTLVGNIRVAADPRCN
jgi:hypothetical protein